MFESAEAVARAFFARWNDGDADGLAVLFAKDADFVNVVGLWWRGRAAIRRAHAYGFRHIFHASRIEITELSVRSLGPGVYMVHTVSTLDGQIAQAVPTNQIDQTGPDGEPAARRVAVMSMLIRRRAAGFEIVSCHVTDRVEGADTYIRTGAGLAPVRYRP
ncbi:uncharacterized protein (TIGR02246 family) [Eilatimonas milleporae]|uniref:Uncharacterized protein (TIGR02246 family) n=1 Tax=Eilatimonas milleporae TaxID=911205 RepID=A0A3M0CHU6_9PROT|nr:uncharacterized protein (TIGR02246 family) [Eilatimonas milleporae]